MFLLALFTAMGMLWTTKNGMFLGMIKAQIFALRTKVALIMNILIIGHLIVNLKVFMKELKILFGWFCFILFFMKLREKSTD